MPLGRSITYNRSKAVNASLLPSGDGTGSRICFTTNVGVSSMGYSNFTSGPTATSAFTMKGISLGSEPSMGTRHIPPPYEITTARESGVKE